MLRHFIGCSCFSLAEELSERVHALNDRLTNTSDTERAIANIEDALADLLDKIETSLKNSEETKRKVDDLKDVIKRIRVSNNNCLFNI